MRPGSTPELTAALEAAGIATALMARLEFQSETLFIWTGLHPLTPTGTADSLLNGNRFEPLAHGVVIDIGDNTFSYSGSSELPITLNVPSAPPVSIAAAQTYAAEYQGRAVVLWRAIRIDPGNTLNEPVWAFRRIRTGTMDKVEEQADGQSHRFTLTVESHQGRLSNASSQTYLNQRDYDPNDSSQDFAVASANGSPAPTKGNASANYAALMSFGSIKERRYLD